MGAYDVQYSLSNDNIYPFQSCLLRDFLFDNFTMNSYSQSWMFGEINGSIQFQTFKDINDNNDNISNWKCHVLKCSNFILSFLVANWRQNLTF